MFQDEEAADLERDAHYCADADQRLVLVLNGHGSVGLGVPVR